MILQYNIAAAGNGSKSLFVVYTSKQQFPEEVDRKSISFLISGVRVQAVSVNLYLDALCTLSFNHLLISN